MNKPFGPIAAAAVAILVTVSSAEAKIVCKDGFQAMRDGQWLSTPYCNDEHLAEIARRHGVKVTGKQVRASAAKKYELCRFVGISPPARDYCPDDGSSSRR